MDLFAADGADDRAQHGPTVLCQVYGFALKPRDFLFAGQHDDLVTRVLQSGRFDYWEFGMDPHRLRIFYESFIAYQKWLLVEFDRWLVLTVSKSSMLLPLKTSSKICACASTK